MNFIFDLVQHILQLNGSLKFLYSVPSESLKIHPTLSRPPTIKIMVGGKHLGQICFEIVFGSFIISYGHVIRDFVCEAKTRCNF